MNRLYVGGGDSFCRLKSSYSYSYSSRGDGGRSVAVVGVGVVAAEG